MIFTTFAVLFLSGTVLASPIANQYVDSVLNTALRNEIRNAYLDPTGMQDFTVEFQDKVAIIGKVKGKADFTKGNLSGLSEGRRFSECQGPYYSFGARNINCTVEIGQLKVNYDGKLKYGKMPKVNIKGKANMTRTIVFFEVTSLNPGAPGSVKNFYFTQVGQLDPKFTGLGPLNKFVSFLENGFKSQVEAQIFNLLNLRYKDALNRAVGMIPLPN